MGGGRDEWLRRLRNCLEIKRVSISSESADPFVFQCIESKRSLQIA